MTGAAPGDEDRTLRVAIADDDPLARTLIVAMVERDPTLELVGSAEDAAGAISLVGTERPDVVVLDWMMPGGGPAAARSIADQSPETRIVALTASDTQEAQVEMLRAGAKSFLVKGGSADELSATIRQAIRL